MTRDPFETFSQLAGEEFFRASEQLGIEIDLSQMTQAPKGMADLAFPFFATAKREGKNPAKLALLFAEKLIDAKIEWEAKGPFLNATFPKREYSDFVISSVLVHGSVKEKEGYGNVEKKGETRVVEHTSANPNGPLHVGRARNPIIGDTMARLYRANGYDVTTQYYVNDMGLQVAMLTWGIDHLDEKDLKEPDKDRPDYRLVRYYQKANELSEKKGIEEEIRDLLRRFESGDAETEKKIRKACETVLEGMEKGLAELNIFIDEKVWESRFVRDGFVEKVFEMMKRSPLSNEEDDAFYLDLSDKLPEKSRSTKFFYMRSDGTTLYPIRDIAYHRWKIEHFDGLLDILGEDHKLQSKQVQAGLEETGTPFRETDKVLFYSFVGLPEGKMSTRRGTVVYLDDLVEEAVARAYEEVVKRRTDLDENAKRRVAEIVGRGAVRFNIIKVQPEKNMTFKWEEALNFEGESAPYLQYGYARCRGIMRKGGMDDSSINESRKPHTNDIEIEPAEMELVRLLGKFPTVIKQASESAPHLLARYLNELVSQFNAFYRDCPVLDSEDAVRKFRLELVLAVSIVLENGLYILGIDVIEDM